MMIELTSSYILVPVILAGLLPEKIVTEHEAIPMIVEAVYDD